MRNGASYGWNGERRKVVCVCRVACGAAEERGGQTLSARDGVGAVGGGWFCVYFFSPVCLLDYPLFILHV